ncbi:MAG: nickel-dependent hydrogenase large subunit [Chloroflexota bacterium]|nr:MAG: NADH-quinone oxidoreductase subunit D [Chloroflexota bacterium]
MTYTLALGPFHPAWRGPQRFILRIAGEQVADVEYQGGLNERGCAERLPRLALPEALQLVTRICGTCSLAHALAFCQALEQLCAIDVPERAAMLRVAAAETERAISHLRAAAGVLRALGVEERSAALEGLRERAQGHLEALTGARVGPDFVVTGGVRRDLVSRVRDELLADLPALNRDLYRIVDRLIDNRALLARTIEVGTLPRAAAEQFGVRGPLARASGIARDTRFDYPYAAYGQLAIRPIVQEGGDVYARLVVLLLEAYESVKLVEQALRELPQGAWRGELPEELSAGQASGAAEGPRGMIRYTVESDGYRLTRVRIDCPRQLDRLLARTLLAGALPDNTVAIIASVDSCVACAER